MADLTPQQEAALKNVLGADKEWREAKLTARETARIAAEREITSFGAQRDLAVRVAFSLGVPKAQIGTRGLKTSSPNTVNDSLARTEAMAPRIIEQEADPIARFTKWDPLTETWRVTSPAGETVEFDGRGEQIVRYEDVNQWEPILPSEEWYEWAKPFRPELRAWIVNKTREAAK